ncbi:MAG: energy transducer TonB [Candidatus Omnitrophota bacterium]
MDLIVTKNNLIIAVLVSAFAHLFFMSAVTIVTPEDIFKTEPFTRVTFLGPILEKTAFDIMVGDDYGEIAHGTTLVPGDLMISDLSPSPPGRGYIASRFPYHEGEKMTGRTREFLEGVKISPHIFFRDVSAVDRGSNRNKDFSNSHSEQNVIYRPPPPVIMKDLYGDKEYFTVRVTGFVDGTGDVKDAKVKVSSGHFPVDTEALKHFSAWRFHSDGSGEDIGIIETDIIVHTVTGGKYDKT